MRRRDKEIADRSEIDQIMDRAIVCRVAMCEGGNPYVVPVNFGYSDNCLYIHSALEGKKLDILRHNPKVAFEVDIDQALVMEEDLCECSCNYRSVVGFGLAVFIQDPMQKRKALDCIVSHYTHREASYTDADLDKVAVVRVDIKSVTGKKSGYSTSQ
jgi:uncharacterized protein